MDRKRKFVQFVSAFLYNANIKGFISGRIYQGKLKTICVPGLNCYSCPGAVGACPFGTLQAQMGASPLIIPLYAVGLLMLFGVFLGRFICGWLCPFGLFQELLHHVPSRKIIIKNTYFLYGKYVFLSAAIIFSIYSFYSAGYATPWFCKYICPAGTIFAGFPLLLTNEHLAGAIGSLFIIKTIIAIAIVILSVIIFRPFCKYVCPLGAIYGFFNKISLIRISHNGENCISCGKCNKACKMNICPNINPNSPECIRCGQCVKACGAKAIEMKCGLY